MDTLLHSDIREAEYDGSMGSVERAERQANGESALPGSGTELASMHDKTPTALVIEPVMGNGLMTVNVRQAATDESGPFLYREILPRWIAVEVSRGLKTIGILEVMAADENTDITRTQLALARRVKDLVNDLRSDYTEGR